MPWAKGHKIVKDLRQSRTKSASIGPLARQTDLAYVKEEQKGFTH